MLLLLLDDGNFNQSSFFQIGVTKIEWELEEKVITIIEGSYSYVLHLSLLERRHCGGYVDVSSALSNALFAKVYLL